MKIDTDHRTQPAPVLMQHNFFQYRKVCRFGWIRYLGLLGKVRLHDGPDELPIFHGMPPEDQTVQFLPEALKEIQRRALENPRNWPVTIESVIDTLGKRSECTHIDWRICFKVLGYVRREEPGRQPPASRMRQILRVAVVAYDRDRDLLAERARMDADEFLELLDTLGPDVRLSSLRQIFVSLHRMVGIDESEEEPAKCPGYMESIASFQKAIENTATPGITKEQRREHVEEALEALRKFMEYQNNDWVSEPMHHYLQHYEEWIAREAREEAAKKAEETTRE
ncbi:hypothetical protein FZEAL_1171 [Fusarium zealandicum]|uniref:Uncharacterized protein n=1 Tax=Fusarium zealandicum TaxID=1053134 RepID=A0A8H4UU08_9HYPO|nr:hypothetical protein FZEAL_1171 [Fusarium zealandicum]